MKDIKLREEKTEKLQKQERLRGKKVIHRDLGTDGLKKYWHENGVTEGKNESDSCK